MEKKILVFGPWVGEFGWELFECQSYIRKFSERFDYVICSSLPNNKIIYEDFCDEFIPFEHDRTFSNGWSNHINQGDKSILSDSKYLELFKKYDSGEFYRILPCDNVKNHFGQFKFVEYGNYDKNLKYDVVVHMRNRVGSFSVRNWPQDKWVALVDKLFNQGCRIACVGGERDFCFHDKMDDFRSCGLRKESDLLKSSGLIVGGLSGGVHFASLCGASRVTWGDIGYREGLFSRYNPFNLELNFIPEKSPSVDDVFYMVKNIIEKKAGE
jgi:hypothetical protein